MVVVVVMGRKLLVPVQMPMPSPFVIVTMHMPPATDHRDPERNAQPHEHQPNGELERLRDRRRDRDSQGDEDQPDTHHRDTMPHAPREPDEPARLQARRSAQDGRHRGDVVGIQCMAGAEQKAEREEG